MGQNAGQGSGKAETIRQHIFSARLAQLAAKELISVKHLAKNGFGGRRVDVALLHGGAGGKPAAGSYILFKFLEVGRVVLLHQPVAVRPAEIENVVRILLEQRKIAAQSLG